MKKINLYLLLLFSLFANAQTLIEDFENGIPATWATFETGTGVTQSWSTISYATMPQFVCQGSQSAYMNRENVLTGAAIDWLVSPLTTVPSNGQMFFSTKTTQVGGQNTFYSIKVSTTSQTNSNTFTNIISWDDITLTSTALVCEEKTVDLSAYAGQNVYIAFVMENDNGDRWILDDIRMHENIIRPMAFIDTNTNSIKDSNEVYFTGGDFQVNVNSGPTINYSGANGSLLLVPQNTTDLYDISYTIHPEYSAYYTSTGASYNDINLASLGTSTILPFPITVNNFFSDVEINTTLVKSAFPGTNYVLQITYKNNGSLIENGTIQYTKPTNLPTINSIDDYSAVQNPTGFTINYTNLLPQETRHFIIRMLVPAIPTVQVGENVSSNITITATNTDAFPNNNSVDTNHLIVASYDPNDKNENHGPTIVKDDFTTDDYLVYTIRFQNTGNAPTSTVRVEDFLDSKLNPATVRMVLASDDYILSIQNNHLVWKFDPIFLTPASINEADSQGFITFKVKPFPGYQVGDIIPNNASIYFDTNPAIVTNTFLTEFVALLSNESFNSDNVTIYPNPSKDFINIQLSQNKDKVEAIIITDVLGKIVRQSKFEERIDISNLNQGVYFITLISSENEKFTTKIIRD